ncbi:MAG: Paraquat-inducible protein [Hydrocarboniphaga sp.]|uniref:paraquat-inducible protein A n=1 Tax=Hydrocarboniphaga sp. TaxID=2033016 RepID=UPI00260BDB7E|nr:paraquat-inducible protein A [Hydrocarboniphaga sp.]MDB5969699.1 Paraquat-inducible protein [Hydrocarboniphaga sp.]
MAATKDAPLATAVIGATITAQDLGVAGCTACGQVVRLSENCDGAPCPRCNAPLWHRKRYSFSRTWALLIAAGILYIPANLLPIMRTRTLGGAARDDTILSGVVELWQAGSWDLAVIVFVASILVPVVKIGMLVVLLVTSQRGSHWARVNRSRMYRLIEFVGHWSMLDVFVVALMAALVRFQSLADVTPRPGAVAFGAVVVLTMLASRRFDPRLIWDPAPK